MMMRLWGGEDMVELALTYEDEADISDYAFPYIQLAQDSLPFLWKEGATAKGDMQLLLRHICLGLTLNCKFVLNLLLCYVSAKSGICTVM